MLTDISNINISTYNSNVNVLNELERFSYKNHCNIPVKYTTLQQPITDFHVI